MTGQDAVNSAKLFNEKLELDGLILTKLDSDTRGGALLSAKVVTGKPVKFLGTGEKLDALEEFRPEGMAQRILGMGDILALVNTAIEKFDQEETAKVQARLEKGLFTLDDFITQMNQVTKLGPMGKIMGLIPGMNQLTRQFNLNEGEVDNQMGRMKAIYYSMTPKERKNTDLLDSARRRRIARGAGVDVAMVGHFMKQFEMSRDMMKAIGGMGMGGKLSMLKNLMSGNLGAMGGMMGGGLAGAMRPKKSGFMEKKDRNKKKKR
jgi:signal recognition particle subunit SRP54